MDKSLKCHFVNRLSLYSQRIIYGYKCDMDNLIEDIKTVRGYILIEENIENCGISGQIIDNLEKYKQSLINNYTRSCRNC